MGGKYRFVIEFIAAVDLTINILANTIFGILIQDVLVEKK